MATDGHRATGGMPNAKAVHTKSATNQIVFDIN